MMKYIAYLILFATIAFNLYLNYPETQILADPNDNVFQYSLVYRTNWIWENYGCPLSLSCLPNLVDHNVTTWAEGYPLPFYYPHIPQIAIVSSYNLFIKPILSLISYHLSLYQYYNWTRYLLLVFFPLPVFFALRIVGFAPILAALTAFFASHFSTDGLYGIDPPSFLWRGYGLTSQLYAIFFLPLGLAFTYKALRHLGGDRMGSLEVEESRYEHFPKTSTIGRVMASLCSACHSRGVSTALAIIFLTLTTMGHLGIGIIGLLSTIPFLFIDFKLNNIILRAKKLLITYLLSLIALSYWLIPILLNNNYHMISFWDPIWKFNSYGWYEVVRQFFQGEIFDWQRSFPIITGLVTIGFFVLLTRNQRHSGDPDVTSGDSRIPTRSWTHSTGSVQASQDDNWYVFPLLFAFWFLIYFGRSTWGSLIDLIPGMKDFHQHRFIVGVHIAALFLIPAGIEYLLQLLKTLSKLLSYIFAFGDFRKLLLANSESLKTPRGWQSRAESRDMTPPTVKEPENRRISKSSTSGEYFAHPRGVLIALLNSKTILLQSIIFYILSLTFISTLAYFTVQKTVQYAQLNNRWIGEANSAYRYDEKNFQNLASYLSTLPSARLYAGRPGNWGHDFRLGSTQMYMLFGVNGFDMSQFLPETWSPLSENEQNFDERVAEDYDLLNLKYIIADKNHDFTPVAKLDKKFGPFELYKVPTTGWFDVVTSPMFVKTDKTNYINLVHFWHRSYARRWKMHPLISVEKNPEIPNGMQKIIEMRDEVSYSEEGSGLKGAKGLTPHAQNIFSNYPFVFPEATVSGKIRNETINRQTYSATIEVPDNCNLCFVMFKMSYHPDWQVKVDGKPASKFAIFPFYLATQVTPGTHQIEFTYQPNNLKVIILIIEIIIIIIFIFYGIVLRR